MAQLPVMDAHTPVLIAGPTASGKSALALWIADTFGGVIVNADALQVYDGWSILTARPDMSELARAPHHLYGHVPFDTPYSVGHWLRDVTPFMAGVRPIIVGGTGLYFRALTEGLVDIPATPPDLRAQADKMPMESLLAQIDPAAVARIDTLNRARVQRAWEVQRATGRSIATWQAETPAPALPLTRAIPLVLRPEAQWLNERIARRFDAMLHQGALAEAEAMRASWNPTHLSSKAIGAAELIAHLNGESTLDQAREAAIIGSRQYGKRQRTWFRKGMRDWHEISLGA